MSWIYPTISFIWSRLSGNIGPSRPINVLILSFTALNELSTRSPIFTQEGAPFPPLDFNNSPVEPTAVKPVELVVVWYGIAPAFPFARCVAVEALETVRVVGFTQEGDWPLPFVFNKYPDVPTASLLVVL